VFNPHTNRPEERILRGDILDKEADRDAMRVKLYDNRSLSFFKNMNKRAIEAGLIVPDSNDTAINVDMINAITDEEIDEILSQQFYTLKNRLDKFTSPTPVERILRRSKELNKGVKTIENITARLSELQADQRLTDGKLEEHYRNLNG
jgi:hypothetical protein